MIRAFAKWSGVVFLLLGIFGFFFKELLNFIHFDAIHNAIHLLIGAWGIWAGTKKSYAVLYAKMVGIIYLIIGSLGVFTPGLFGSMNIQMVESIYHLLVGALGTYVGFVLGDSKTGMKRAL
ncbi:DUF4383 domain-containing protein [Paenibacillus sp. J2TS4]|uniref:DUF4383 domain-containing protein n=1 Tax=Paenibacillus sp. J2TS4 TaxID=2807194 RepID=UPI001B263C7F|nr:DUF4383 domain-containing protein [Paenibacillus sp. J2TS4]GIP34531.1 hypothetical protein J2TS4_37410 [Paenibacillus sp. J2TS4]